MDETFLRALVFLAQRHGSIVQDYREHTAACEQAVIETQQLQPVSESVLERLLRKNVVQGELTEWGTWLFLPAPQRGTLRVPVLNVLWNFAPDPANVSVQAGLFFLADGTLRAVGWRFETPEFAGGRGSAHAYYHAQPTATLRSGNLEVPLPLADPLTPSGEPTFPLDAADEVDLLLCVMLSIYGLTETRELLAAAGLNQLPQRLKAMRTVRAGARESSDRTG